MFAIVMCTVMCIVNVYRDHLQFCVVCING